MAPAERLKVLALPLPLLLLLCQALVAARTAMRSTKLSKPIKDMRAHSSWLTGLNCTLSSEYSRRQAGQRPLRFSLMWCQQNRQIYAIVSASGFAHREDGWNDLVATHARLEVEVGDVHLLETERAFGVLLRDRGTRVRPGHTRQRSVSKGPHTASSSLQYASWTPARTCDLDCEAE